MYRFSNRRGTTLNNYSYTDLVRDCIKLSVELPHGDGLGVDGAIYHPLVVFEVLYLQQVERLSDGVYHAGLTSERFSYQHEPGHGRW